MSNTENIVSRYAQSVYTIYLASPIPFVVMFFMMVVNFFGANLSGVPMLACPILAQLLAIAWLAERTTRLLGTRLSLVVLHGALTGLLTASPALAIGVYSFFAFSQPSTSVMSKLADVIIGAMAVGAFGVAAALVVLSAVAAWFGGWMGK